MDTKQEELVERYRELSLLVQQISGEQVEENTFNYLNSWVSGLMMMMMDEDNLMTWS